MRLLSFFIALLFALNSFPQAKVDSLLQLCKKASESKKSALYLELSLALRKDSAKSNSYARQALKLAEKQKQLPEQAKAIYYLGETSYYSGEYSKAVQQYEKAIALFESLKDSFDVTNCYNSLGLCYHLMYQGDKAINQFIKALRTCENDKEYTADILSNIAMAHAKMNNHRDAITYYKRALNLNTLIKDSASMAVNYNGLGNTYTNMDRSDSAIVNFRMAYNLFGNLGKTGYQNIALTNIATLYPNYPDSLDKAIISFNQASIKFKELGWNQFEPDIKHGIGLVYAKKGKYKEALNAFQESLKLTDKLKKEFALKTSNYLEIAKTYKLMGDYQAALKYHELFVQYNDSMVQKEKYEQIVNLEKQYETEKKQNEINQLQAKHILTDIQLQKNKQLKTLGFVTATLLLFLILFVLNRYFDKAKSNKLLESKNRAIEKSENELRILNAAKNKFFSIIAHDLKNPFHTVMGYSYLLSKDYNNFTEAERRKFADDIHHSTNNIFRLLQNLLEWSRSQTGRLTFNPREIELKQIVDNSVSVLRSLAEQKNIRIEMNFDDNLRLFADNQMIETVLRNLVNNAIKFTPVNGLIKIEATQTDGQITIGVKDSGIGISDEDAQNLFKIDSTVKRKGTNNEDGSGLGLILCREFVAKNNGNIWVNSAAGEGSSFFFTVPARVCLN